VRDANGRALAYNYSRENEAMAPTGMRGLPAFQTAGMAALADIVAKVDGTRLVRNNRIQDVLCLNQSCAAW
jgi:hypothetical protein